MLGDDINPAAASCSSPPLLQVPDVPRQLPTMPHFASQQPTQGSSQQDRTQRLLVDDCGFRPGSSFSSSEQPTPPKLVPIFKRRRPSRQARLEGESGSRTLASLGTRARPIASSISPQPGQPRLRVPPPAKFRCPLKTTWKQSSERAEAISKHRTSSDSSCQVSLSHLLRRWTQTEPHSPWQQAQRLKGQSSQSLKLKPL